MLQEGQENFEDRLINTAWQQHPGGEAAAGMIFRIRAKQLAVTHSLQLVLLAQHWFGVHAKEIHIDDLLVAAKTDIGAASFILISPELSAKLGKEKCDDIVRLWAEKLFEKVFSDNKSLALIQQNPNTSPLLLQQLAIRNGSHLVNSQKMEQTEEQEDQNAKSELQPDDGRTLIMRENLAKKNWPTVKRGNEEYLQIEEVEYQVVTKKMKNFSKIKAVSLGADLNREIIILDTDSKFLNDKYQQLKIFLNRHNKDTLAILKATITFIRENCLPVIKEQTVQTFIASRRGEKFLDYPVIPLEEFLKNKMGVCRHHALILAYFLDRLSAEGILSAGEVHHYRADIKSGAHAWVFYKPIAESKLYLADSTLSICDEIKNIKKLKDNPYGTTILEHAEMKYLREASQRGFLSNGKTKEMVNEPINNIEFGQFP